jgi:hypothetical protein
MRTTTGAVDTALAAQNVIVIKLVELDFVSGFVRVHSAVGTIIHEGNSYLGVGQLGAVDAVHETADLQSTGIRLSLSGVPNILISVALNEVYQGRRVKIWDGLLDDQHHLIASPIGPSKWRMATMKVSVGETSTVVVVAEDLMADWDKPKARRYNDAGQQTEFPGDLGMEFVSEMVDKTLFWGRVVTGLE